jgi:succinyl-CoA synthetase beta subunit
MNLFEHETKAILKRYGLPVPEGVVAATADEARGAASGLGGSRWAVKAQVRAGQRGKAGGVRIEDSADGVAAAAKDLLGSKLVTGQTTSDGLMVTQVLVEQAQDIAREIYAAVMIDRTSGQMTVIASAAGGVDVEESLRDPAARVRVDCDLDPLPDAAAFADVAGKLDLSGAAADGMADLLAGLCRAFAETDSNLIELNPVAVTTGGDLCVVDAKMVVDDNALFRHDDLAALRESDDETDPQELEAHRFELNYVKLGGSVGVMCTGAGMSLAVIDLIRAGGGEAANFMDVRPVASRAQVAQGVLLLLRNPNVKSIVVVATGGGILRCDLIAEGVAEAYRQSKTSVPIVFRASGTGKEIGELALRNQAIPVTISGEIDDAVAEAVKLAGGGR